ncbi:hypothetical protein [Nocardia sp. CC227C]|uniref:hypothetical protein n=1 Tax=Nocardia sp. CC227C TaxID=3044562 RepID=UPI00278BEF5D|nr:hypothetical protein [Nocardia sp. CC227C]
MRAAGVEIDDHGQPGPMHVYPPIPTPEGRAARAVIVDRLRDALTPGPIRQAEP